MTRAAFFTLQLRPRTERVPWNAIDPEVSGDILLKTSTHQLPEPMGTCVNGAPGTIRTSDPQIRSLMLYPAELRAHFRGWA
jgi:hypothetical protein